MTKPAINIIIDATMGTHSVVQRTRQRDRAPALGVGFFLFALYLLSYRGGFHSVDEVSMFAVAESLVKFGEFNTDQIAWTQWTTSQREAQGFFGVDGHVYSKKGLAISLLMAPLYWLGLVIPGLGMLQTASLLNAIVTALTGGLVYLLVRRLGYDEWVAMGVTLLYGLATIAWVYSKYLFSEPLAGLLLVATVYLLVVFRQEGKTWYVALAGLTAGLAVVTRANNLFLVPIFGLYVVAGSRVTSSRVTGNEAAGNRVTGSREAGSNVARRVFTTQAKPSRQNPNSPDTGSGSPFPIPCSLFPTPYSLLPTAYFLLGLIPPALMLMAYNWARTGNPLETGYDLTIFSPHVLLGLYKLLFSPLRGLFVYSPILLLSIPGLVWLWRRHRAETALIAGITGITIALFSVWSSGEGLSWGSRFLVPVIPLLCLALAPVLARGLGGSKAIIGLLLVLGGLSLIIQFLGVAINPWVYLADLQTDFGGEFFLENTPALTDFRYTQIGGQLRSWSVTNSDVAWWQPWGFDALAFGLSLVLVIVAAVNIKSTMVKPILFALLSLIITYSLLTRYFVTDRQFGPPGDAYTHALNAATERASPDDWLVTVAQNHYHVPMNRFKTRIPIIGFAQQQPPIPETALPLLRDSLTGQHTWLTTVGFLPAAPNNAAEQWLTVNAFKASDQWFDDVRLIWYGAQEPTVTRSIDATLGQEVHLLSVALADTSQPGQVLPVEFVWAPLHVPGTDYDVFLQLLANDGTLVAQHDGPPNGGYTPTSAWAAGKEITDRHGLALPSQLPAANYRLIAGMYDPISGERLPVDQGRDFVELGTVAVESPGR